MEKRKLHNKVYDVLKWVCIIALPAISIFYTAIAAIWNLPYGEQISKTIDAIAILIGALIGISTMSYNKDKKVKESDNNGRYASNDND